MKGTMTATADRAFRKIIALRKYPLTQSAIAEKRILKCLSIADFTEVVEALEGYNSINYDPTTNTVVPRG